MSHIFISYSRKNEVEVMKFTKKLIKSGFTIWQDILGKEGGIPYSTKWFDAIVDALYQAEAAIIIDTTEWRKSAPCSKEYELIQKNNIPYFTLDLADLDDIDHLIISISQWCKEIVYTEENRIRTELFSNGKKFFNEGNIYRLFPKKLSLQSSIKELINLSHYKSVFKERAFADKNPEAKLWIQKYLKETERKIHRDQFKLFWIAFIGVVGFQIVNGFSKEIPEAISRVQEEMMASSELAFLHKRIDEDPIASIKIFSNDVEEGNLEPEKHLFAMRKEILEILDIQYPEYFYDKSDPSTAKILDETYHQNDTSRFSVIYSNDTGYITLLDQIEGIEQSIQIRSIPRDHSFIDTRGEILVACENEILVFDLTNIFEPIRLRYNFESINEIRYDNEFIYGISEKGNIIVWKNPILPKNCDLKKVSEAKIYFHNGNLTVLLISEGKLYITTGGDTKEISLNIGEINGIDVSPDGDFIAISSVKDGRGSLSLLSSDLQNLTWSRENIEVFSDVAVSSNGRKIYVSSGTKVFSFDIDSGDYIEKNDDGVLYYTLASYNEGVIASTSRGYAIYMDENLQHSGKWIALSSVPIPIKQIALSKLNGTVFTATKGGGHAMNCNRVNLDSGLINRLAVRYDGYMESNTSVATSLDGAYVAFGFPNGAISVWDSVGLNEIFSNRSIAENVISLRFKDDNTGIYLVGESGSFYEIDFHGFVEEYNSEMSVSNWMKYQEKAEGIHRKMYDLGLCDYTP